MMGLFARLKPQISLSVCVCKHVEARDQLGCLSFGASTLLFETGNLGLVD